MSVRVREFEYGCKSVVQKFVDARRSRCIMWKTEQGHLLCDEFVAPLR